MKRPRLLQKYLSERQEREVVTPEARCLWAVIERAVADVPILMGQGNKYFHAYELTPNGKKAEVRRLKWFFNAPASFEYGISLRGALAFLVDDVEMWHKQITKVAYDGIAGGFDRG